MSRLLKFLLGLSLLALVFGTGYLSGSQKSSNLWHTLNRELTSKIEMLEQSLRRTRLRLSLNNTRHHLSATQAAIEKGNFVQARKELDMARGGIRKVAETVSGSEKEELAVLASSLAEVRRQILRSNPRAKSGVEQVIQALEKFLS